MPGRVEAAGTFQKAYAATRVLPPGEALVYVLFITSVCLIVYKEKVSLMVWRYFLLLSSGIGIALTYNRSYWGTCIFCFAALITFANSKVQKRIRAIFFIGSLPLIMFSLVLLLSDLRITGDGTISAMSERFSSMFTGRKVFKSDSIEWRKLENKYALQKIAKNPFLGIGLGNDYRPPIFGSNDTLTKYIHNGYFWILLNVGLVGLLPLMWFFIRFIIRGFGYWSKIKDTDMNALLAGFTLSGLGILLVNIVSPMFLQWYSIVVISVSFGLGEVIIRLNKGEVEDPG
jgi:O-antigen ligase